MNDTLTFAAAHWEWIVAYPLIGAFLHGLFDGPAKFGALFGTMLLWPVALVAGLGAIVRSFFE